MGRNREQGGVRGNTWEGEGGNVEGERLRERLLHDPDLNAILPTRLQQHKLFYKFDKQLLLRNGVSGGWCLIVGLKGALVCKTPHV